jgi:hypothetical protein
MNGKHIKWFKLRFVSSYGLGGWGSIHGRGKSFSPQRPDRLTPGSTQPPIRRVQCAISKGIKQQERNAAHSLSYSAEVKNAEDIPPLPIRLHGTVRY